MLVFRGLKQVSLRRAALISMSATLAIVGALAALIAFSYTQSEVAVMLDSQLRQIAFNAGEGVNGDAAAPTADKAPEERFSVTIWGEDGGVVHRSYSKVRIPRQEVEGFASVAFGGETWRVYSSGANFPSIQVAQRESVRRTIADRAAFGAAAPVLLVIPLSWFIVGWAMTRALRRLNALAREIAARGVEADEPLDLSGIPAEIAPLAESLNGLIVRLKAAMDAQKVIIVDAAHELRSPLAAMQIQVENLKRAAPPQIPARAADIARGVTRASVLVDQLLSLARLDEAGPPPFEDVELEPLLAECVAELLPQAQAKNVDIRLVTGPPTIRSGCPTELRALFTCLIDNAIRNLPNGGKVDVRVSHRHDRARVEVLDTGPGLPFDSKARIFERAFGGGAKTPSAGLGLAIARRVAERHGFPITLENRTDVRHGAIACVELRAQTVPLTSAA